MKDITEDFHKLMSKYKFVNPSSEEIQDYAIISARKNFKKILKKTGDYSAIASIIVTIFFLLKEIGLKLSFLQIKVVLALTAFSVSSSVATGGYVLVKHIVEKSRKETPGVIEKKKPELIIPEIKFEKQDAPKKATTLDWTVPYEQRVGIQFFSGEDALSSRKVTSYISNDLKMEIGSSRVSIISTESKDRVKRIVTGSVRKMGKIRYITVKIINAGTSQVEFVTSKKAESDEELKKVCSEITKQLSGKIK